MPSLLTLQTFPNGSFDDGLNSWVVLNQRIRLGGIDSVAGFPTPIDPTTAPRGGLEAIGFDPPRLNLFKYFTPAPVSGQAYSTEIDLNGRAVMLSEVDAVQNNPTGVGAVVHGPVIHNAIPVRILQGTTVQFDWEASGGGDAFDVFGYIVESNTGATQLILDATGEDTVSTQALTTNKFTTTATGDYYFVFVSGTWDASNGRYAGARLSIDNILISPFGFTSGGDSLGDAISLTLEFDGPVSGLIGTTSNGIFLVNGIPVNAVWSGTDGGTVRVLTYTITQGDVGQVSIDESALSNVLSIGITDFQVVGSIRDLDTNFTLLPHVDGVLPTIAITASSTTLKSSDTATLTFTLSEASTDFAPSDLSVSGGTISGFAGSGTNYTATFTPTADSTANGVVSIASSTFSDAAGNFNIDGADANNTVTMTVDTLRPTITVSANKASLKAGEATTLTFTISEASTDFTSSDVSFVGGTLSGFSGSGTTYTATFTPTADSTANGVVSVASGKFSDAAGNFNDDGADADNTVAMTVDTLRPTVTVGSNKTSLKASETAVLTFILSEPSTDFNASDLSVSGGSISGFFGSGTTYTATFTPSSNSTAIGKASVASGKFSDAAGNQSNDGADADNTVTMAVDTVRPTIAVAASRSTLNLGESTVVTFTLSESSTDFTGADVSVSGGTISGFAGTGTSYTAFFTLNASGSNGAVSVASNKFSNASGNFNTDGAETNNSVTLAPAKLWGTSRNDYGRALATGPDGSIYMAGDTEGNLAGQSGSGMRDIFLSKMNADGTAVWTKLAGTRLIEGATHLAVASDGSVYMSASSQGTLNRAGNSGSFDAYLLKYDANGNMLWTARQGTSTTDLSYSVATDNTGEAYLVGQTKGQLGGQRNNGNYDGFITKYSAQGTKLWSRLVGTSGIDVIKDVVTDASGFVYVTGSVSGTLAGQTRIGGTDAFITKYARDGTVVWTKVFGTKTTDYAESIGLGSDGSIYVAGQTLGSMNGASSGNYDVFLTKFSAAGIQQWSRQFGSGKADNALDLVVGSSGVITITGHLGLSSTSGLGLADAFTASFNANGTQTAYEVFGTGSDDYGTALTEGLDGVLYMAGYTLGSAMMGRPSNGATDAYFFARANQTTLNSSSATATASASPDVFTFAAGNYNASITGGFAYGDKLVFPASMTNLSLSNTNPTDGQILITASGSGQQIQVTLTGVALGLDDAVTTLDSFWATFGPPGT